MGLMNIIQNTKSIIKNRFVLFFVLLFIISLGNYFITGNILPSTDNINLWFYSGLIMIIISIFFIEPYYTSPKNVITNTIPILLVFLAIKNDFNNILVWKIIFWLIFTLLCLSIISLVVYQENKSPEYWLNKLSNLLKRIVTVLGKGKILFSTIFLLFLYLNITTTSIDDLLKVSNGYFLFLMITWGVILSINPSELPVNFKFNKNEKNSNAVGEIFGVQSKKIFLAKLFEDRKSIKKFDIVKFRYSMQDAENFIITGIIFDTYLLNKEKWIKILQLDLKKETTIKLEKNTVYKISEKDDIKKLNKELNIDNFVGVIVDNSNIGRIKFEYSKKINDLEEGNLLELEIPQGKNKKRLFYQVVSGITEKEKLEAKNETGYIRGEAIQLGEWQNDKLSFQKFGWVPEINTPIFKADTTNIEIQDFEYPEFKLGVIPNTTLPSVIDLHTAISHHLAVLGVTGTGKSFITREIIKELKKDTNVICVDFTGEYIKELEELNPVALIDKEKLPKLEEIIAKKETEANKGKKADKEALLKLKSQILNQIEKYVEDYIRSDDNLSLFELPELSNTTFILEFTQLFLEGVFNYAKKNTGQKICIVLEEAHTIIPETNFLGDLGDYGSSKALVSKMSQIALQGRKYGVGLIVIAQRTANVSKTVLTQCNTIISFQAFDETSFNFLGNYFGKDFIQTLPNLQQYHAIVTGKAVKANIPMIIDLTRE